MTANFFFIKFCNYILGVNRRSVNQVVMCELGGISTSD